MLCQPFLTLLPFIIISIFQLIRNWLSLRYLIKRRGIFHPKVQGGRKDLSHCIHQLYVLLATIDTENKHFFLEETNYENIFLK